MFNPQINDKMFRTSNYPGNIGLNQPVRQSNIAELPSSYPTSMQPAKTQLPNAVANLLGQVGGMFEAMTGMFEQMKTIMMSMMQAFSGLFGNQINQGPNQAVGNNTSESHTQVAQQGGSSSVSQDPTASTQNAQDTEQASQTQSITKPTTQNTVASNTPSRITLQRATAAEAENLGEEAAKQTFSSLSRVGSWFQGFGAYLGRKAQEGANRAASWATQNPGRILSTALSLSPFGRGTRLGSSAIRSGWNAARNLVGSVGRSFKKLL